MTLHWLLVTGMQSLLVRNWFQAERDRFKALTWTSFTKEFKDRWLPEHWEQKCRNLVTRSRQSNTEAFKDWIIRIETLNANLVGTTSHKNEQQFRAHIEDAVCERLNHLAIAAGTASIPAYRDWKAKLIVLDNERLANMNEILRLAGKMSSSSRINTAQALHAASSSYNSSSSSSAPKTQKFPPQLTSNERSLLSRHDGCFKCRKFCVGHRQPQCNNIPPKTVGYKELTEEDALKAKRERDLKPRVKKETTAATTTFDEDLSGDIAAAVEGSSPVACGVLDYGSDSDFSEYVVASSHTLRSVPTAKPSSEIPSPSPAKPLTRPLSVPHFTLRALVHDSSGPCIDTPIRMLIDCGSSTALVRSDVVKKLGLRLHALPSPISLDSAWGSKGTIARSFIKLRVSLRSLAWTSCSIRALVVDSLCAPVILGQPFLSFNHLVLDCASRTCIDKRRNIDLLNPVITPLKEVVDPTTKPRRPKHNARVPRVLHTPRPRPSVEEVVDDEHYRVRNPPLSADLPYFVEEIPFSEAIPLHNSVPTHPDEPELRPTIAAVRETIERLSLENRLKSEESKMRSRYADVFPDGTPKLSELPTDVYHRFRLKDPNMVIARRSYDCPKKYREAWKALLNDHLASGRMRPSSSPYASPCFLIPKSDPTAPPRWVNDYRLLNDNTIPDRHPLPTVEEILSDCGKGKIFGKLDMTNSFFQTRVHPDDVPYTAVTTPFGLYEWLVMPQGCRNAPATHQRRMVGALRPLIGKICHVYIDDIVIWSQTV